MGSTDSKSHWDSIYTNKREDELSWYQSDPKVSLELIRSVAAAPARVLDVGAGMSPVAERLLGEGYRVGVLDISKVALERAKAKLGPRASSMEWIVADVTNATEIEQFDVWHDRAVFHFLTDAKSRQNYADLARRTLPAGGHLIVATFGLGGPLRCSGLEVVRYDAGSLAVEFSIGFEQISSKSEVHQTPWNAPQEFGYGIFRRT